MTRVTGAQAIIRLLERQGVRLLAGIPGGANLPLYDALSHSRRLRHVLARHEQAAGFIAQGIARVTGRPQVCLATSGPGATNVLTAIADAKRDSIPVVCITGQVPLSLLGTDAFQEIDARGLSVPVTKHNYLVRSAAELLEVIPAAFRIAASGRPGPVWIDVPKDVQTQTLDVSAWPQPGRPTPAPMPSPAELERAAAAINAARKPVLCLGGGVIHSHGSRWARALAERASIPTAMTLMGLGAMPADHPLSLGMLGMHGARSTNLLLDECDLFIAAGMRFDDRATGQAAHFCPHARIIHIDIDAAEVNKLRTANVGLVGDAGRVLESLLPLVPHHARPEWMARVQEQRRRHRPAETDGGDWRSPRGVIRFIASLLDENAIVATDVGQHQMWTAQAYPFRRPRRWLTSGGLGTMGFGLPAALGAALARPGRTVVCFSGDGSLLMNIQELATVAEENANVKLIVMNNNSLGLVRQQQDLFYGKRFFASDFRTTVDFVQIAAGFGLEACDLGAADDPLDTLEQTIRRPGPCLINVPLATGDFVFPMVPPGAANRDMIGDEATVETCA